LFQKVCKLSKLPEVIIRDTVWIEVRNIVSNLTNSIQVLAEHHTVNSDF